MKLQDGKDYVFLENGTYMKRYDLISQSKACVFCTKEYVFVLPAMADEFHAGMVFMPTKIKSLDKPQRIIKDMLEKEYTDINDFQEKMKALYGQTTRKYLFKISEVEKFKITGLFATTLMIKDKDGSHYVTGAIGTKQKAKLRALIGQ